MKRAYPSERKFFTDEQTGAKITKLTAFPCVNQKVYFHINQFTPDSKTLIFFSERGGCRSAGKDIYKVDVGGMNLAQMTDRENLSSGILTYNGKYILYAAGKSVFCVDMESGEEQELYCLRSVVSVHDCPSLPWNDQTLFIQVDLADGQNGIARLELDGSGWELIYKQESRITHAQVEPSQARTVAFQSGPDPLHRNIFLVDSAGGNMRPLELPYGNGHWMWVGDTGRIMSNLEASCWGISVFGENDAQIETIVTGADHYWHASCDNSGQWMVSDTNWPDAGIQIINRLTKKRAVLCHTGSSQCHPSWTHPHPSFSPDLKYVAFNSDATGIGHVYLAEVPDALLKGLGEKP